MTTIFTQGPKQETRPPPPYTVGPTGSTYLAATDIRRSHNNDSLQRMNTARGKDETKFVTLMQLGSIIILVLCALSCIIALHRNTKIMEQNLDLLERQLSMLAKNKATSNVINDRVKRMINPMDGCPPCPTEPPQVPIEPYRNPVSVLNEQFGGNRCHYEVASPCEDPPIHSATLTIDDPGFTGKSWRGKGKTKQDAKQAAAWEAIQNDMPTLIELVAEEYRPVLYNPACQRPTISNNTV